MRALRRGGDGGVVVVDVPEPTLGPDDALVEMRWAGICTTDLEIVRGYTDHDGTLGHEMVGRVLAHPDPSWVGRRVVPEINVTCGRCRTCRRGDRSHCETRTVLGIRGRDGGFAERVAIPVRNLHEVPARVDDEAAVFTEPLAAAFRIAQQVDLGPDTSVAVVGDGKLGLLVALALRASGAAPVVYGRHPAKLAIADAVGLRTEPADRELEPRYDLVVDATGRDHGLADALARVRPRGTLVVKSTVARPAQLDTNRIVVDEIHVVGSRCGPFDRALRALAAGTVDPRPLVEATYPLARGDEAFVRAQARGAMKILLEP